jgi:tetratricopeptide (TPR) repeat protein
MRSAKQYIAERFPWLNLFDSIAVVFVLALVAVSLWPHSGLIVDLVFITAIPGSIAAIVWSLTFWQKARVQIGRLKLRYKAVRRIAGIAAVICLPFLLLQQASIYLQGPNILRELPPEVADARAPYPKLGEWKIRVVVAIAHLEGDDGQKIEGQLRDALANLDPRLHVTPVILNRTIAASGRPQGIAHLDALEAVTGVRVESLIWGGVKGVSNAAVGPLYATKFSDYPQFGGAFLPSDFKLPELPPDDLCKVLRLIVATDSAEFMVRYKIKFGDALEPLIREVSAIVSDPRKTTGWSGDTRARMNLTLGIANRTSGVERKSRDSLNAAVAYFQRTLDDWTRDRDPLEWAMTQRNLADALCQQFGLDWDDAPLHPAMAAFQNALTVYQSRSDRLDAAHVQLGIASDYEIIGRYEPGRENVSKAVDHYRAALGGFDPRTYPDDWGDVQLKLANALRVLALSDRGTKSIEDAIAANKAALTVYSKQDNPIRWAEAQGQLAQCLNQQGQVTSNPDDFRQSISLLRQVLDGYPRENTPKEWAELQAALGGALMGLDDLEQKPGNEYPQQAAIAYRASLEELTLEESPIPWATAKQGLGNALGQLGHDNSDSSYLNQAIDAYNDSLKVFKSDRQPLEWATVKYELGETLVDLGELGSDVRYLQQAVQTYREALAVLPEDSPPVMRKDIQDSLNEALDDLHRRGWNGS